MKLRLLIVDDDPDFCEVLSDALSEHEFDCFCVGNGQTALDTIRDFGRPDLILLDLNLPVMSGFEFRRAQLLDPKISDIPVIVMSGYHLNGAWRYQLAAIGYFLKPIDIDALVRLINEHNPVKALPRRSNGSDDDTDPGLGG